MLKLISKYRIWIILASPLIWACVLGVYIYDSYLALKDLSSVTFTWKNKYGISKIEIPQILSGNDSEEWVIPEMNIYGPDGNLDMKISGTKSWISVNKLVVDIDKIDLYAVYSKKNWNLQKLLMDGGSSSGGSLPFGIHFKSHKNIIHVKDLDRSFTDPEYLVISDLDYLSQGDYISYRFLLKKNQRKNLSSLIQVGVHGEGYSKKIVKNKVCVHQLDIPYVLQELNSYIPDHNKGFMSDVDLDKGNISGVCHYHTGKLLDKDSGSWDFDFKIKASGAKLTGKHFGDHIILNAKCAGYGSEIGYGNYSFESDTLGGKLLSSGSLLEKGQLYKGDFVLHTDNSNSLTTMFPQLSLKNLDFKNGTIKGIYSYHIGKGLRLKSLLNIAEFSGYHQQLQQAQCELNYENNHLFLNNFTSKMGPGLLKGAVKVGINDATIQGGLEFKNAALGYTHPSFNIDILSDCKLNISGKYYRPHLQMVGNGRGHIECVDENLKKNLFSKEKVQDIRFDAVLKENKFDIQSLYLFLEDGILKSSANYHLNTDKLVFDLKWHGKQDRKQESRLLNNHFLKGKGSIDFAQKSPAISFSGKMLQRELDLNLLVASDTLKENNIELPRRGSLKTDISLEKNYLKFSNACLLTESGPITGDIGMDLQTYDLDGNFSGKGLLVSGFNNFLAYGILNIDHLHVGGKVNNPTVYLDFEASKLSVLSKNIDRIVGKVLLEDHNLNIQNLDLNILDSELNLKANYNLLKNDIQLSLRSKTFYVERLPLVSTYSGMKGCMDGVLNIKFRLNSNDKSVSNIVIDDLEALVKMDDFWLFGTNYQDGWVSVQKNEEKISGYGKIGTESNYIEFNHFELDRKNEDVNARVSTKNFSVGKLVDKLIHLKYIKGKFINVSRDIDGELSLELDIYGKMNRPSIKLSKCFINHLKYSGFHIGSFDAIAGFDESAFSIDSLVWKHDDARVDISGKVFLRENLPIDIQCKMDHFDINVLKAMDPKFDKYFSDVNCNVKCTGYYFDPIILGVMDINDISKLESNNKSFTYPMSMKNAEFSLKNSIFNFSGNADVYSIPLEVDVNCNITDLNEKKQLGDNFYIKIPKTNIKDLTYFHKTLDIDKSQGNIDAVIRGNILDLLNTIKCKIDGHLTSLALRGFDTELKDIDLSFDLNDERLKGKLLAYNKSSGKVEFNIAGIRPENLSEVIFEDTLWQRMETLASLRLTNFLINENTLYGKNKLKGVYQGILQIVPDKNKLNVSGSMRVRDGLLEHDLLSSQRSDPVSYDKESSVDSTEEKAEEKTWSIMIDQIDFRSDTPFYVKLPMINADLDINGVISGPVQHPKWNFDLNLHKGILNLPGGNVYIQNGSKLKYIDEYFRYIGRSRELLASILGEAYMFSSNPTGNIDTNRLDVSISGDLLSVFRDNNDLSVKVKDSSIGHDTTGLANSLLGLDMVSSLFNKTQFSNSGLVGKVLAGSSGWLTDSITRALRLDAIQVSYHAKYGMMVNAVKNINPSLSIVGSYQLQSEENQSKYYDFQVNYRPFKQHGYLNKVLLGVKHTSLEPYDAFISASVDY